jgi:predicted nucleic acid-binding protein
MDTGYVIALEIPNDQHHDAAVRHWEGLLDTPPNILTTSYVFSEIVTFFNGRNLHSKAVEVGERLETSPRVTLVHVDEGLFQLGWLYFQQRQDKRFSLTDCISFVLMHRMGISHALAFDSDFVQAGFQRLP